MKALLFEIRDVKIKPGLLFADSKKMPWSVLKSPQYFDIPKPFLNGILVSCKSLQSEKKDLMKLLYSKNILVKEIDSPALYTVGPLCVYGGGWTEAV